MVDKEVILAKYLINLVSTTNDCGKLEYFIFRMKIHLKKSKIM